MADLKGAKAAPDGVAINTANLISVEMEDLSERDWDELERELQSELEEIMVERWRQKLACFQNTRNGVVKEGDTAKASLPVNSLFTLLELIHMIDVSVNSKYGADLEGITHTIMDNVRGTLESLRLGFREESESLPRQVRAMVQQVLGEAKGKRDAETLDANAMVLRSNTGTAYSSLGKAGRMGNPGGTVNLNLQ
jgi:hypothetical protein